MSDVSPKVLELYRTTLIAYGASDSRTLADLERLQAQPQLDWSSFAHITDEIERELGTEHLYQMGADITAQLQASDPYLGAAIKRSISLRSLYKLSHYYGGPSLFPRMIPTVVGESATSIVLRITQPQDQQICEGFFVIIHSVLQHLPTLQGRPRTAVTMSRDGRQTTYQVPLTRFGLFDRIVLALKTLFSSVEYLNASNQAHFAMLAEQQATLRARMNEEAALRHKADEALRVAETALQSQSRFLAMMTHELRTPLYGVLGAIEIARSHQASALEDPLEVATASGTHLLHLLDDLLTYSQMEAGEFTIKPTRVGVNEVANHIFLLYHSRFTMEGARLTVEVASDCAAWVMADRARLVQVLTVLLDNALKFAAQGHARLRFSGQNPLTITLDDNGIGVSTSMQQQIFEPFQQADLSIRREYGGTGLGLSVAQHLIGAHGHIIRCSQSELGGAAFSFQLDTTSPPTIPPDSLYLSRSILCIGANTAVDLPPEVRQRCLHFVDDCSQALALLHTPYLFSLLLIIDDASKDPQLAELISQAYVQRIPSARPASIPVFEQLPPLVPPLSPRRPEHAEVRVLVAEDHPVSRKIITAQLEHLGCVVSCATDGEEALDLATSHPFDLILMDLHMPRLDGETAARDLRQHQRDTGYITPPIYAFTADPERVAQGTREALIFNGVLSKPCSRDELKGVVQAVRQPASEEMTP